MGRSGYNGRFSRPTPYYDRLSTANVKVNNWTLEAAIDIKSMEAAGCIFSRDLFIYAFSIIFFLTQLTVLV